MRWYFFSIYFQLLTQQYLLTVCQSASCKSVCPSSTDRGVSLFSAPCWMWLWFSSGSSAGPWDQFSIIFRVHNELLPLTVKPLFDAFAVFLFLFVLSLKSSQLITSTKAACSCSNRLHQAVYWTEHLNVFPFSSQLSSSSSSCRSTRRLTRLLQ